MADRYRLDRPLGRGGMGEVWQAVDETFHRPVAVKLMAVDPDPTAAARFEVEARAAARLNHPNLVAAYDSGNHDGRPYLVMELVEGHNLGQELDAQTTLEPARAADIAAQVARGLAAAHQQAVVHRDIKPSNLMLAVDGTVKIADFGLAQLIDEASAALTVTGRVMGTSLYLAPERILGHPAGPAADVYALGCVIYQMLTGHPPFQGDSPISIAHQHVEKTPAPVTLLRPCLPELLADCLPPMLAKAPETRPTAAEIAHWLEAPLEPARPPDITAPMVPLPVAAPLQRHARARKTKKTTMVACAVGVLAFGAAVAVGAAATSAGHQPTSPSLPSQSSAASPAPGGHIPTQSPTRSAQTPVRDHEAEHGKHGRKEK